MCNQEGTTQELQSTNKDNQLKDAQQIVHKAFDKFLEVFIKGKKSLIVDYKKEDSADYIFTKDDINNCLVSLQDVTKLNPNDDNEDNEGGKDLKTALADMEEGVEKEKFHILLWHCYWIIYFMNNTSKTFLNLPDEKLRLVEKVGDTLLFVDKGNEIASTKLAYSSDGGIKAFKGLLSLYSYSKLWERDIENQNNDAIKKEIIEWLSKEGKDCDNRLKNVLLYLCEPTQYPCIISQNHQDLIYNTFQNLVESTDEKSDNEVFKKERTIKLIEKYISTQCNKGLYDKSITPFWKKTSINLLADNLDLETLLKYKKAMILYGPPGTSKSYQARKIAEGMIADAIRELYPNDITKAINQLQTTIDSHIHILQMHPNYTYDDFIIGKSIDEKGKIVVKPGKLMQIIKGIKKDDKIPHFVILDEINRVDISRVFGELFTAMEASYRDKGVELSANVKDIPRRERESLDFEDGKLYLKVPQDLYFIGTMNMIDFSLEQVDFALRRRFLWTLSTYDKKRLDEIISEKIQQEIEEKQAGGNNTKVLKDTIKNLKEIPDDFSKTCTDLNNKIEMEKSLGKSYLIGHAFFSEIVDIFKRVKDWDKAKNILWQVSILPTLEAYCGTMDANMQETFLKNCKEAFIPKEPKVKKK